MKDQLEPLEKLQHVEAPAFLFTRIQAKIQEQFADRLTKRQAILYIAGILLFIAVNITAFRSEDRSNASGNLVSEMNLSPSNQLYE